MTVAISTIQVPAEFIECIPLRFAREHLVVAIEKQTVGACSTFTLGMTHPELLWVRDRIACKLDAEVNFIPMEEQTVRDLLSHAYHAEAREVAEVADDIAAEVDAGGEIPLSEDVLEMDDKAPAVKLVHAMLLQAVRQRASDIHIEPGESSVRIRFRIDGVLYTRAKLRAEVREGIASRIKVMGRMDIAERRLPQDGGVTIRIGDRRIDLRIATLPSQHGERVVMRLLDKQTGLLSIRNLGMADDDTRRMHQLMSFSHGIILVTGPTGSGKSTTLYAMLSEMNSEELNILTLEDPVEYQLPGITQTQVSEKKGFTFAKGLRALVRQDPDIIMVGEIRDLETATVAIQSALTGHLVLSTLHTNDAPSSVTRLLDLGVEPFLAASSVNCSIAQRLVRRVCAKCGERKEFSLQAARLDGWTESEFALLGSDKSVFVPQSKGCPACFETGYSGRTGIYEFMLMNDPIRDLIVKSASASMIKKAALENGMVSLRRNGLSKVAAGVTTLHEVKTATQIDLE